MKLIVIAHRGEAQEFIKFYSMKPMETISNLYQSSPDKEKTLLLVCGEGIFEVFTKLPYILGKFAVTQIYNLGIAGSLNATTLPGSMIEVRTSYNFSNSKVQFESFTGSQSSSVLDCITTDQRVLSDDFANRLKPFADIVDRELWAIAKIAKNQKIPLRSFKLISDVAGNNTNCFDLAAMAKEFSSKMLDHFLVINQQEQDKGNSKVQQECSRTELPFHASFTQTKRIEKLVTKLQLPLSELLILFSTQQENQTQSKGKCNKFILFLENKINPINKIIEDQFNAEFAAVKSCGAKVIYDKKLDTKKVSIHFEINSQTNIDKMQQALGRTKFERIEKIWKGHLDV